MEFLKKFLKDEQGAAMPEYAVLLGIITLGAVAAIGLLATAIANKFTETEAAVNSGT